MILNGRLFCNRKVFSMEKFFQFFSFWQRKRMNEMKIIPVVRCCCCMSACLLFKEEKIIIRFIILNITMMMKWMNEFLLLSALWFCFALLLKFIIILKRIFHITFSHGNHHEASLASHDAMVLFVGI